MKRVAVIGSGGAGKSALSLELGRRTGLPVIHLDRLFWRPGWEKTPEPEWEAIVRETVKGEHWIIDGNFSGTLELRLTTADTIVFFDIPRLVCLWSAITRSLRYRKGSRPDMAPGLSERIDLAFLRWIWGFPHTRRPGILRQLAELPPSINVVHLTSRAAMREFLAGIERAEAAAAA